jgi:purine-binding chemotaxis protein CheW
MISSRAETQALARAQAQAALSPELAVRTETPLEAPADAPAGGPARQYLTFALGNDSYAAAIHAIREILEVPPLTVVPMVPGFVRGVINLRGAVVPVIDLASRFDLGQTQLARRTCVVVVEVSSCEGTEDASNPNGEGERQVLGVLVDAVHEVQEIAASAVEPAPSLGTRIHPDFLSGMAKVNGQLLGVLDLARVLAQHELSGLVAGHVAG